MSDVEAGLQGKCAREKPSMSLVQFTKVRAMDTILRQIQMLTLIPRYPRKICASDLRSALLGRGFDIHIRTIQRDLQSLSGTLPLGSDANKPMGWFWPEDADPFDIPGLDAPGALTLQMVREFFSHTFPPSCLSSMQPHFRKARKLLDALDKNGIAAWPDKIRIISRTQPLIAPFIDPEVLSVAYEALLNDRRFRGTYRRRGDAEPKEYEVSPLGLVFADQLIYLVATLWDYGNVCIFALHRFSSACLLETTGYRPEAFNLQESMDRGMLRFPRPEATIRLKALFGKETAQHLVESPLSQDQIIKESGDVVRIEATVGNTAQLRWWLLGFGDQVEVLEPTELREEMAATCRAMAKKYGLR